MIKKWSKFKIPLQYDDILEKAYAVARLPADKIQEGISIVQNEIDTASRQNREHREKFQAFGTYLRTTWGPLANILSVYQNPVRTNNATENFHLHAARRFGNRPGVWKMLGRCFFYQYIIYYFYN